VDTFFSYLATNIMESETSVCKTGKHNVFIISRPQTTTLIIVPHHVSFTHEANNVESNEEHSALDSCDHSKHHSSVVHFWTKVSVDRREESGDFSVSTPSVLRIIHQRMPAL